MYDELAVLAGVNRSTFATAILRDADSTAASPVRPVDHNGAARHHGSAPPSKPPGAEMAGIGSGGTPFIAAQPTITYR